MGSAANYLAKAKPLQNSWTLPPQCWGRCAVLSLSCAKRLRRSRLSSIAPSGRSLTAALRHWAGVPLHIHCLVPGAGLNDRNQFVRVKKQDFLLYLPHLQAAFRQHLYRLLKDHDWQVDPQVWRKDWGVHIQPAGSGASALKYLGAYVSRTAITNARMLRVEPDSVTFRWKDRSDGNRSRELTLSGVEFARRYLRHALPTGLRSVRYYGFCHPTAKANRMRVQLHSGRPVQFGQMVTLVPAQVNSGCPACPRCGQPTQLVFCLSAGHSIRGPPSTQRPKLSNSLVA